MRLEESKTEDSRKHQLGHVSGSSSAYSSRFSSGASCTSGLANRPARARPRLSLLKFGSCFRRHVSHVAETARQAPSHDLRSSGWVHPRTGERLKPSPESVLVAPVPVEVELPPGKQGEIGDAPDEDAEPFESCRPCEVALPPPWCVWRWSARPGGRNDGGRRVVGGGCTDGAESVVPDESPDEAESVCDVSGVDWADDGRAAGAGGRGIGLENSSSVWSEMASHAMRPSRSFSAKSVNSARAVGGSARCEGNRGCGAYHRRRRPLR